MRVSVTSRLHHRSERAAFLGDGVAGTPTGYLDVCFVPIVSGYVLAGATVLRAAIR